MRESRKHFTYGPLPPPSNPVGSGFGDSSCNGIWQPEADHNAEPQWSSPTGFLHLYYDALAHRYLIGDATYAHQFTCYYTSVATGTNPRGSYTTTLGTPPAGAIS